MRAAELEAQAARVLDRQGLRGSRLLVAASGGVDSSVLLAALHAVSAELDLELAVGHVHHGLRGEEADRDADAVRARAAELGLVAYVEYVDPQAARSGRSSRLRPTLQEAARAERYAALLARAAQLGSAMLATGHTLDDQAETVLLRVLRGCGPQGLGGIPERGFDGRVVRPLLEVERREVLAYARERGVSWREDSSNAQPGYTRNRLRQRWLPDLAEEFNPRLLRSLARLAEVQQRDAAWLDAIAEREAADWLEEVDCSPASDGRQVRIRRRGWSELPPGLATRLLRRAWQRAGGELRDLSFTHLERARRFVSEGRTGGRIELPGGLELRCAGSTARLRRLGGGSEGRC